MKTLRLLPFLTTLLVVIVGLTSIEFASARGQMRAAGQIVLCSGQGLVTVTVDANGTPIRHVKICPDMALNLMASLTTDPVAPLPPSDFHAMAANPPVSGLRSHTPIAPNARDPPVKLA